MAGSQSFIPSSRGAKGDWEPPARLQRTKDTGETRYERQRREMRERAEQHKTMTAGAMPSGRAPATPSKTAVPKRTGKDQHAPGPDPYVPASTSEKTSAVPVGRDYGVKVKSAASAPAPRTKSSSTSKPEAKSKPSLPPKPKPKPEAAPKPKARAKFSADDRKAIESAGARARATQKANQASNAKFAAAKKRGAVDQDAARKRLIGI